MPETLEEKLPRFECRRCNECCRQPGFVYVTAAETESLAEFLGLSPFDFVNRYCDLQDRQKLVLKKRGVEACVFLTEEGCSVHPAKPGQCRDFPVKWRTAASLDYCAGLKELTR